MVRVNWRRQRYERTGILVEVRALDSAARQCLDDAAALADRHRRDQRRVSRGGTPWEDVAAGIRSGFPGCPRADVIAYYAALSPGAIEDAVIASVRHVDTDYDELLASGVNRADAWDRVAERVRRVLDAWRAGAIPLDD